MKSDCSCRGMFGTQGTVTDNVIASGLFNRISFSFGHFGFKSDGIRENNDITENISNVFVQADLNQATSVQLEFRNTRSDQGDRVQLFDPLFFDPNLRSVGDIHSGAAWLSSEVHARFRIDRIMHIKH